jgi:type I restriction enzyme S subunit
MARKAKGGAQGNLSKGDILEFEITIPNSLNEQQSIATVLSDMDTEIESLESKLGKAREIKQGMMQELLTGKIRLV